MYYFFITFDLSSIRCLIFRKVQFTVHILQSVKIRLGVETRPLRDDSQGVQSFDLCVKKLKDCL